MPPTIIDTIINGVHTNEPSIVVITIPSLSENEAVPSATLWELRPTFGMPLASICNCAPILVVWNIQDIITWITKTAIMNRYAFIIFYRTVVISNIFR